MADPCWKAHLQPVFDQVVKHLSDLELSDIADSMLAKSLLELEEYQKLLGNLESSQSKGAARIMLMTLMALPSPSFNTFCGILRDTGLDPAKAVLRLVEPVTKEPGNGKQTALDVSPPMTQMLAEQQQQQEKNEKQKQHPSVIQSKDKPAVIDFSAAPFNVAHRNGKPKHVQEEEVGIKQCKDQSAAAAAANVCQNNPLPSQSPEVLRRPRSGSKLASKGVLLLCSSTPADEQYTSRLHKCLTECGVNAFFLESKERDHVIEIWGKQMTEEKDASLKRYSHCVPVITADFLQKGNCLQGLIDAMLNQADDRGMQILPLLVDTTLEEFKTKHPRLSTYAPFLCSSRSDLQSLANSIHKRLNDSHRSSDDVSMSAVCKPVCKPGGLPGKSAYFCGRNNELHQILSECSSPILALCCITGPTGIGKSSLVAEVAHRVRDGDFPPGTSPSAKWNVLYLDARNLETELQFATEVVAKMKAFFRDQLPTHIVSGASVETDKSVKVQLMEIVSNMLYPCIILDNCDQALKEENREGFLRFLRELTTAAKDYSMALITSCSEDVGVRFTLSGANVYHIRLRPLSDADSDSLFQQSCMHGSTPVSQPISSETVESIRSICEGIPMLIRLAGAVFRRCRESMTQEEIVHELKKRPYKMFKEVSDMGFLSALYNLLPSHLQIFLHGLSLFTGSFTRREGAVVFGQDPVTFAREVLSPLIDYNLVNRVSEEITGDEMQYCLHGLIRNFLQNIGCSEKQFRYFQENYCLLQLERIAALQIVYDNNPQLVTRQMRGFQVILAQLASLVKPTANSSKVWSQFLRLICNRNSFMKCSFSPELRKRLIKRCLSVCVQHSAKSEPKIRLVLSDVLCDLDDLKRASSCLQKVFASLRSDAITAKKMVQARYFLQKARLHTRKGEGTKAISILTNEFQRDRIPLQAREHVECFIALGDAYKSTGKYHEAIENFSQALKRCKEFLGQESFIGSHPDTCNVLMSIGHCHFCIRQYDESLCSFSEALSMHHCLASDVSSLALTYYQMGISRAALGKGAEAVKDFEEVYRHLVDFEGSSLVLLSRQVEAKLSFSQGARAWKEQLNEGKKTKEELFKNGTSLLEAAADSFTKLTDSLAKLASIDSEMTLVLSENLSLLVVIHALLSKGKERQECLSRLRQIAALDSESGLVRNCYVVSYVLRPELESERLIADLPEIMSHLAFYSYVGKRLTASDAPHEQINEDDATQFPLLNRQKSDSFTDTEGDDKEEMFGKNSSVNLDDYEDDWEDSFQQFPVSSSSAALSVNPSASPTYSVRIPRTKAQADKGSSGSPFDMGSTHLCTSFYDKASNDSEA